jgi:F-type H+-transporting ATPase subunit gamma
MASLKAIKSKITATVKTRKVTKAMEAVSAAKMRKAQLRALSDRAYAKAAVGILSSLAGSPALSTHSLVAKRTPSKALYIVITSDKGLAGALNSGVLKAVSADMALLQLTPQDVRIVAIGRRANEFFLRRGFDVISAFENAEGKIDSDIIRRTTTEASLLAAEAVGTVRVAYQSFISTFEQAPTVREMFPFSIQELMRIVEDITPAKGKFAAKSKEAYAGIEYAIEPSEEGVLDALLPRLASIFVYHALLETQASEHSARMVAMKNASDKAGERVRDLTRVFNRGRQAGITREVSEIIGGIEAMA